MSAEISVVSPVYCCADCLRALCARLAETFSILGKDYEIILVDDASPDDAWPVLRELCATDSRIKAIALSRNFGQHYAIAAGIEHAVGRWVVVLDCDLQDRPEEIARLYAKAQEGFDVVFADPPYDYENYSDLLEALDRLSLQRQLDAIGETRRG